MVVFDVVFVWDCEVGAFGSAHEAAFDEHALRVQFLPSLAETAGAGFFLCSSCILFPLCNAIAAFLLLSSGYLLTEFVVVYLPV
jgi:hypothetical protein